MKIDINGCCADDIHAICIRQEGKFFTARPEYGWTEDMELTACFLSEKNALLCIEEMRNKIEIGHTELIWTDTRKSIYSDMEHLRKFEYENRRRE